jgi:hypothetical protein
MRPASSGHAETKIPRTSAGLDDLQKIWRWSGARPSGSEGDEAVPPRDIAACNCHLRNSRRCRDNGRSSAFRGPQDRRLAGINLPCSLIVLNPAFRSIGHSWMRVAKLRRSDNTPALAAFLYRERNDRRLDDCDFEINTINT